MSKKYQPVDHSQWIRLRHFIIFLIPMIVMATVFYISSQGNSRAQKNESESDKNLLLVRNLAYLHESVGSNFRSYLISEDSSFLMTRKNGLEQLEIVMGELQNSLANTKIKADLDNFTFLRRQLTALIDRLIELKQNGVSRKQIDRLFVETVVPMKVTTDDAISKLLASMQDLYVETQKTFSHAINIDLMLTFLSGFLSILIAVLLSSYFSEKQIRLINRLRNEIRLRKEMVGVISHELKNPLNAFQLSIEFVSRIAPGDVRLDPVRKAVEGLKPSIQRMSRLVSDLVDMTRIETNKLFIEPQRVMVAQLMSDIQASFGPSFEAKNLCFTITSSSAVTEVFCDRNRTLQVMGNLLNNAMKFTPPNGKVSLQVSRLNNQVRFSVEDSGKGISKEDLEFVFNQYWQANDTAYKGTGLGLWISKGLVEAQNGSIGVQSVLGRGSVFYFTLPEFAPAVGLSTRIAE